MELGFLGGYGPRLNKFRYLLFTKSDWWKWHVPKQVPTKLSFKPTYTVYSLLRGCDTYLFRYILQDGITIYGSVSFLISLFSFISNSRWAVTTFKVEAEGGDAGYPSSHSSGSSLSLENPSIPSPFVVRAVHDQQVHLV